MRPDRFTEEERSDREYVAILIRELRKAVKMGMPLQILLPLVEAIKVIEVSEKSKNIRLKLVITWKGKNG